MTYVLRTNDVTAATTKEIATHTCSWLQAKAADDEQLKTHRYAHSVQSTYAKMKFSVITLATVVSGASAFTAAVSLQ